MALVPIPVTDEQSKAVQKFADLAQPLSGKSANSPATWEVLGTTPEDVVGLVIGDPLHFVRTAIASKYDERITRLHRNRNVTPEPVSPSLAIPLLRAAYDESRPELQELWAQLIAAAMDPQRANRVRRSFIDTIQSLDPLDALVLKNCMRRLALAHSPPIREISSSHG
jgi:hypothetical protein